MFIKDIQINNNGLVFIKSNAIKAFPCGRRRSGLVDADNNNDTVGDRYYIPFDPEARLNTEANNRKHSGLNGYKNTYLNSWNSSGDVSLVIAGYLFDIASSYHSDAISDSITKFGKAVAGKLGGAVDNIFVNIKLANMTFFAGSKTTPAAATEILRDQTISVQPLECLDQLYGPNADRDKPDSYYFYGLSFSSENL